MSSESWLRGVCGDDGSEFEFKPRCEIFADTGELGDEPVKFQLNLLLPYGCYKKKDVFKKYFRISRSTLKTVATIIDKIQMLADF